MGDLTLADGPWSFADAPGDAAFLDFGPLKLPELLGMKVHVELDKRTRKIGAISVRVNDCDVQLQVVSAPRGQGVWADVRRDITARLKKRPGNQHAVEGHFGPELIAQLTGRRSDGLLADSTMRFAAAEGDRWMIRAVVTGPSVTTDATMERVNALISRCAVERGDDALGPRKVLELAPPPGLLAPPSDVAAE